MVEVFKTNVDGAEQARDIVHKLSEPFPSYKVSFDIDDCDKILSLEGERILLKKIISTLSQSKCGCQILE
jgi:hypothetical protein